jgi:ABC-type multidrug transport system permease subunit
MNLQAIKAIYLFEMARFFRTITQSFISPVLSTSLYFVVFGTAIGSRIDTVEGVSYGAFIVPGLIMLSVMTQATANASFGIYFPKFIGTIYELLSAPVSFFEIVIGYVGAAATKALFIGCVILSTAFFFVDLTIAHPLAMIAFLVLTCLSFSLLGFIIGARFETGPLGVALFVFMSALWGIAFTGIPYSIALKTGNPGAVNSSFIIFFPFAFITTAYLPLENMSGWLAEAARYNPVTYLLAGLRSLFSGWDGGEIGKGFAAIAVLGAFTQTLAFRALKGRVDVK